MKATRFPIIAGLTVLWLGVFGPATATEDGPFPVWWSSVLELESLDQIDARLAREMWPQRPGGLPLYKYEGDSYDIDSRTEAWADSCNVLMTLTAEGYEGLGTNGFALQLYNQALCRSIGMMRRAEPAERSFLRDFVLTEDSIHDLPALVNILPSCDFHCRQGLANERRVPLSRFEPVIRIRVVSDEKIEVWTIEWKMILTFLARGDFNGDGLDDLLVLVRGGGILCGGGRSWGSKA